MPNNKIKNSYDSFEDLNELEKIIKHSSFFSLPLGIIFSDLNYYLTEKTEVKNVRDKSVKLTYEFINKLNQLLKKTSNKSLPMPVIFGILTTIIAEVGQYRHETYNKQETLEDKRLLSEIRNDILPNMRKLRAEATKVLKVYFTRSEFKELEKDIRYEIFPIIDGALDRYLPFRVIEMGRLADKLLDLSFRIEKGELKNLLEQIYSMKYPRFGTSGIRGKWGRDFTEIKAKAVVQAICDYTKREKLHDKFIVIGYDSRLHADEVAKWAAEVCINNGIKVYLSKRDTPTPALDYWGIEKLGEKKIAAIINCTASHNPIEWQGIKYSPPSGCPAPTWLTDWIAARANRLQLRDFKVPKGDLESISTSDKVIKFDPIFDYCDWILSKENGINWDIIKHYFKDRIIVIDEMHGAGRGYFDYIFGKIGIKSIIIHEKKDPYLGNLDYANPEEPFIDDCKKKVREVGAELGLALDTDADRYGVVDIGGLYFRPNQIMPLLAEHFVNYKKYKGKVVRTITTSLSLDKVAELLSPVNSPNKNVVPAYLEHAFYELKVGKKEYISGSPAYVVMVGIKYVVEGMQMDQYYRLPREPNLDYRHSIVIAGEESGGLTTCGHLPDKDGIWANLNIAELVAAHQKPIKQIWKEFLDHNGEFYSNRVDIDSSDVVKDKLIDFYLGYGTLTTQDFEKQGVEGLKIVYIGGVRYDFAEINVIDETSKEWGRLIVRASGTEPLTRIYTESSSEMIQKKLEAIALRKLEELSEEVIRKSHSYSQLVDILTVTEPSNLLLEVVESQIRSLMPTKKISDFIAKLERRRTAEGVHAIERRNRKIVIEWEKLLSEYIADD